MTRRDFIMLSKALNAARLRILSEYEQTKNGGQCKPQLRGVRRAAAHIADAITEDNPTFDAARFLCDCGYGAYNNAGEQVVSPEQLAYRPRDMDDAGQPVVDINDKLEEGRVAMGRPPYELGN